MGRAIGYLVMSFFWGCLGIAVWLRMEGRNPLEQFSHSWSLMKAGRMAGVRWWLPVYAAIAFGASLVFLALGVINGWNAWIS